MHNHVTLTFTSDQWKLVLRAIRSTDSIRFGINELNALTIVANQIQETLEVLDEITPIAKIRERNE